MDLIRVVTDLCQYRWNTMFCELLPVAGRATIYNVLPHIVEDNARDF